MVDDDTVEHSQFDHTVWLSDETFLFDSSGHSIFVGFSDTDAKPPTEFDPNQHKQDYLIYLEDLFWMVNRGIEELQDVDHLPYPAGDDDNTNWLVKRLYGHIEDSVTFVVPDDGSDTIEIREDDLSVLTDYTEQLISARNREMILLRDGHKDHLIHGTQPLCAAADEIGMQSPTVKLPNPADIAGKESKQPNFVSPLDGYDLPNVIDRSCAYNDFCKVCLKLMDERLLPPSSQSYDPYRCIDCGQPLSRADVRAGRRNHLSRCFETHNQLDRGYADFRRWKLTGVGRQHCK